MRGPGAGAAVGGGLTTSRGRRPRFIDLLPEMTINLLFISIRQIDEAVSSIKLDMEKLSFGQIKNIVVRRAWNLRTSWFFQETP